MAFPTQSESYEAPAMTSTATTKRATRVELCERAMPKDSSNQPLLCGART